MACNLTHMHTFPRHTFRPPLTALVTILAVLAATGPTPGKWTRGFNHDAIVSVANPAASKAFGER